jgi:hypothetical protein
VNLRHVSCGDCKSTGLCRRCQGEGYEPADERTGNVRCEDCAGSGECTYCFEARNNARVED